MTGRNKMANTMILKLDEVVFDEKLYPRMKWNWHTSYQYAQAMKSGAQFPDVEVAKIDGKYYLVDGKHRTEARRFNKETHLQVVVNPQILDFKTLYIEAIKRNMGHGRQFSVQEKTNIALKLEEMKFEKGEISKLINVPIDKLDLFISKRVTHMDFTNERIALKKPLRHMSKGTVQEGFKEVQNDMRGDSQIELLDELILLVSNKMLNMKNPTVKNKVDQLFDLLADLQ
jgi:hypothetical protein